MWGIKKHEKAYCGYACSHTGHVRKENEDSFLLNGLVNKTSFRRAREPGHHPWRIAGVFDGMGGGERGREASGIAARELQKLWAAQPEPDPGKIDILVRQSFRQANNRILSLPTQSGVCGTTGTVFCTDGTHYKLYHLGDSRAYLLRDGALLQLTRDQTLAQMKLELGLYAEASPQAIVDSHKLTEYIGRDWTGENLIPIESDWLAALPGDRFLLCSDGLYDMVSREGIQNLLQTAADPKEAAHALVDEALRQGGADNITCVVIYL